MIRKYLLPALALAGVLLAMYTVRLGATPVAVAPPVAKPSKSPYVQYVAGAGIIEPQSENISIGVPIGQVVTAVLVKEKDRVVAGQELMQLSDRTPKAELQVRRANLKAAQAKVAEAQATLADQRHQLEMWENVKVEGAVSRDELSRRKYAAAVADAKLRTAEAEVVAAEAAIRQTEDDVDRLMIRVPKEIALAEVLQVNVRPGEYAPAAALATPLIVLGTTETLHVRVDIDENDAWRVLENAPAVAYVRGNAELRTELRFVRIEPYVVPKRSLTGESTERVDTRVLQAIYAFERNDLPVRVGQQMDVFIDAKPAAAAPATATAAPRK